MEEPFIAAGPLETMVGRHTPGPWTVSVDSDLWPMVMGGGQIVANINPESFHGGVADLVEMPAAANASLISAAPDLLMAVQKLIAEEWTNDASKAARAAITKALGLTPNAELRGRPLADGPT